MSPGDAGRHAPGPAPWQALAAAWRARDARERSLLQLAAWVLGLYLLWALALQPAWATLRSAPARLDALDAQLQQMQAQAAQVQALRALPPLPPPQARAALQAATARLGAKARLSEQGPRAVLTLTGADTVELQTWLQEVRTGARAHAVEVDLQRQPQQGLSGTVVVALPEG